VKLVGSTQQASRLCGFRTE